MYREENLKGEKKMFKKEIENPQKQAVVETLQAVYV